MFIILFSLFSCKKENSEIPLAEHPQPIFERPLWQNLNGYWQFKPDSTNVGLTENWQTQPESFDKKILIPFSWASPMSETGFDETPEDTGSLMEEFARAGFLNIAGGCCGTTPEHIAQIAERVGRYKPRCRHGAMFSQLIAA